MPAHARVKIIGADKAISLLAGVARRLNNQAPVFELLAGDVYRMQARHWTSEFGGKQDKERRSDRDPEYMVESGALHRGVTQRGSRSAYEDIGPNYLFVSLSHSAVGLAEIHRRRGREVFGEPSRSDSGRMARRVNRYILTGRTG